MNDIAGLIQDCARRDQNKHGTDCQMQGRELQEDVCHHPDQHHYDASHQHTAHKGHIFTGRQDIGGAAEEHQCRTAQRHTDYVTHTGRQIGIQDWTEDITQETREGESGKNTRRRIRGFIGQEHQSIHADQRQDKTR